MSSGSLLGVSVLELRTDQRPLNTGLASAERKVDASGARMQASVDKRMSMAGRSMSRAGTTLSRNLTVPIVALAAGAADLEIKFQSAMEMIHTQAGASQREVDNLRGKVLALAKTLPQSPQQLAQGLFHLESIGLRGAKAMDALKLAAEGAAVGNANLEDVATALGSAWLVNIKGAGNLKEVMALLNATVGAGNMRFQQLTDALGTGVLPTAKEAGLSIRDVMGALAVFTDEGYQASSAAAQFSTALHFLTNPTTKADTALKSMGMSASEMAQDMHKPNGLLLALKDLKTHLDKLPGGSGGIKAEQVLGNILPGGRGRIMLTLINQLDRYQMKLGQIQRTTKGFNDAVTKTQQTDSYKIHTAWSTIEADAIRFGQKILPELLGAADTVVKDVDKVATAFGKLSPRAQHAILTGGLLVAGIGPAMKLLGVFSGGVGKLLQVAQLTGRLLGGNGLGSTVSAATRLGTTVATMEVGTLIARNAVGGPGGPGGSSWPMSNGSRTGNSTVPVGSLGSETIPSRGSVLAGLRTLGSRAVGGLMVGGTVYLTSEMVASLVGGKTGSTIGSFGKAAGGGAALGSLLGPAGTLAGAAGGAIGEGIVKALGIGGRGEDAMTKAALRFGQNAANDVLSHLPKAIDESYRRSLSHQFAQANYYQREAAALTKAAPKIIGPRGSVLQPGNSQNTLQAMFLRNVLAPQEMIKAGQTAASAFITGFDRIRFKSSGSFMQAVFAQLSTLPKEARNEAGLVALQYAAGLTAKGQLPKGALRKILAGMEKLLPGFRSYLKANGMGTAQDFADAFTLDQARANLQKAVNSIEGDFGGMSGHTKVTLDNMDQEFSLATLALKTAAKENIGAAKQQALKELSQLKQQWAAHLSDMLDQTDHYMAGISGKIKGNSASAASAAGLSFQSFYGHVQAALSASAITTSQAYRLIAQATDQLLKSFGAGQIPLPALIHAQQLQNLYSKGKTGIAGVLTGAERGGLVQFGRAGDRGRDAIPVNFGGRSIAVGSGEVGAVLTKDQQAFLNARTADMGGLPGVFSKLRRPHHTGFAAGGYVYPFPGLSVGRTDQGKDYGGVGNVLALGPGVVRQNSEWLGWPGSGGIVYQLTGGPRAGRNVYVMEDFAASIADNTNVTAGQTIGRALGGSHGIEAGWANSAGSGPLTPYNGAADGTPMPGGVDFANFVAGLAQGKLIGGLIGGAAAAMWKNIKAPGIKGTGALADLVRAATGKMTAAANAYGQKQVGTLGGGIGGVASPAQAKAWTLAAMALAGVSGSAWENMLLRQEGRESSYSPTAVNRTDINAQRGDPSEGIMQITGSNFARYHLPGHASILNPVDNIASAIKYIEGTYGGEAAGLAFMIANGGNAYARGGFAIRGPVSTFGPPGEGAGSTAYGGSDDRPGLALNPDGGGNWNDALARSLARKWFYTSVAGRHGTFQVIDKGPSAIGSRGPRKIDFTGRAAQQMGFSVGAGGAGFPTDAIGTAVEVSGPGGRPKAAKPRHHTSLLDRLLGGSGHGVTPPHFGDRPTGQHNTRGLRSRHNRSGWLATPGWGVPETGSEMIGHALRSLHGLLGDRGDVATLQDLYASTDSIFQAKHPDLQYVITQDALGNSIAPYLDQKSIALATGELMKLHGWEARIIADYRKAQRLIRSLIIRLRREIEKRKRQIRAIKHHVRHNLHLMDAANKALRHTKDKATQKRLKDQITGWRDENQKLGGDRDHVGTGGQLGTLGKQLSSMQTSLGNVMQSQLDIQGPSGHGGTLNDARVTMIGLNQQLGQVSPTALAKALAAARAQGGTTDNSELASLLEQQNQQLAQQLAVSQAQYGVLSSLPPFGGSFATGGMVPGPAGAARTVIAHGGETITPAGEGRIMVVVQDGAVDPNKIAVIANGEAVKVTRQISRNAARALPGRGGGLLTR